VHRRHFFINSAAMLSSIVSAEGRGSAAADERASHVDEAPAKVGRPVPAVSIGFGPGFSLPQIAGLVDQEGARGADLIALPETFRGQDDHSPESLEVPPSRVCPNWQPSIAATSFVPSTARMAAGGSTPRSWSTAAGG